MANELIIILFFAVSIIAVLVWAVGLKAALTRAQTERDWAQAQAKSSEAALQSEIQKSERLATELGTAQREGSALGARLEALDQQLSPARAESETLRQSNEQLQRANVQLQSSLRNLDEKYAAERTLLLDLQKQFKDQFDSLTKGLIDANAAKFLEQNKQSLDPLLAPLRTQLDTFQKKVEEVYGGERAQMAVLLNSVERVENSTKALDADAKNLTSALRGQSKVQGDWGEVVLEQLLQSLGLVEGRHYEKQETYSGEEGERLRPDFVLRFPDGRRLVVDAKVSLTAYYNQSVASEEAERKLALKQHLDSVRAHIDELSRRDYAGIEALKGPKVIMFVAIEPAYIEAVRADAELYASAFRKGVILATQSSLYTVIATLEYTWKQQEVSRNAEEIAKQAGALFDKFAAFVDDLESLGKQMETTRTTYGRAWTKLTGQGSLVSRSQHLKSLGVPTKKHISQKALIAAELYEQVEEIDDTTTAAENSPPPELLES